ncbi:MAG: M28 family peptidase, partial [Thermoplasmata archaeon]|nr:M28 family peptidase [Thermoplasmata archaeon]
MRRKLVVLFLALLITSTAIVGIINHRNGTINIASAAEGSNGEGNGQSYQPIINYSYVWNKTSFLSKIVFKKDCNKGRAFGTLGEQIAAENISTWMQELGLENVKMDKINKTWGFGDIPYWAWYKAVVKRESPYIGLLSPIGNLTRERIVDKHYIHIKVYKKKSSGGKELVWDTFLTYRENNISDCFPLLEKPNLKNYLFGKRKIVEFENLTVKGYIPTGAEKNTICLVLHSNWTDPYKWKSENKPEMDFFDWPWRKIGAFIVVDDFNDTYFMSPSRFDAISAFFGMKLEYPKPGFSIRGSVWDYIAKNYLNNDSYEIKADIYSEWHYDNVESYNVIGKLEGRNSDNVVDIVCAHYDCWWNQGTIDEAAETALVLGIAKYMKKLEEEKGVKPEHTVKFIAFGGEEMGFRGTLDYIKKYVKSGKEKVRYVINPGNFGHTDSKELEENNSDRNFKIGSDREFLKRIGLNIADALGYNESFDWNAIGTSEIEAEDSQAFYALRKADGVVQFGRWPFKGYHRDGDNHNKGDVLYPNDPFCGLVNDTFKIESDIVLLTALYLCYEDVIKDNLTILNSNPVTFDSGNDGRHDSVRIHFNVSSVIPTGAKIRVDLFYANNSNNSNDSLTHTYTRYFLIGENGTAHGSVVLSPLSRGSQGNYTARLRLYDVNGTLVDEDWTESFFLNLLDVPIADFTYSPSNPTDVDDITFNAKDHSYPSAGENPRIVNYTWDFGDGSYEYGGIVTHRYADDGYYNVTLTIIDSNGKNASIT